MQQQFLILVKTKLAIFEIIKLIDQKIDNTILEKIKWSNCSEIEIENDQYLAINLNEITLPLINKLIKFKWILIHHYLFNDKIDQQNNHSIKEIGIHKYKLINAINEQTAIYDGVSVHSIIWKKIKLNERKELRQFFEKLKTNNNDLCWKFYNNFNKNFNCNLISKPISKKALSKRSENYMNSFINDVLKYLGNQDNIKHARVKGYGCYFNLNDNNIVNIKKLQELDFIKKVKMKDNHLVLTFAKNYLVKFWNIISINVKKCQQVEK